MKYVAPDYEKVTVEVADVFAAYGVCVEREYGFWTDIAPCEGTENYHYQTNTLTGMGYGAQCWLDNIG